MADNGLTRISRTAPVNLSALSLQFIYYKHVTLKIQKAYTNSDN